MSTQFATEVEIMEAVAQAHHLEKALLLTRIERLSAIIREHGIPLPEDDPALGASDGDHLARCRDVVKQAYDLLAQVREFEAALFELRDTVGSGVEMLRESWRDST